MPGGGGGGKATSTSGPWPQVKPYILGQDASGGKPAIPGILPEAAGLYNAGGPQYFEGNTLAGFTPNQVASQNMTADRAQQGMDPLNAQAGGYLSNVIGGQYLGGQGLGGVSDALWAQVQPRVNSAAGLAGRSGSGAHEGVLGREFTNALAPYAFNQYAQERGLQQQAAMGSPAFTGATQAQDYLNSNMLGQVGQQQQTQEQAGINAAMQEWNYNQNLPQMNLQNYMNAIYGIPGSQTVSSQSGPGTAQQVAGGILGLGGLATGILGIPGVM